MRYLVFLILITIALIVMYFVTLPPARVPEKIGKVGDNIYFLFEPPHADYIRK